jgi:beta-glucosidase
MKNADAIVVIVGEMPYAEFKGDRITLDLTPEDIALVEKAKSSGAPVTTILLSGRPLILGSALDSSDAFVAAWLPGSEGEGVADVLFGDVKPTGKLPREWPRNNDQFMSYKMPGKPLFKFGFGLTY